MKNFVLIIVVMAAVLMVKRLLMRFAPKAEIQQKIQAGATVLDVRTDEEFHQGHHPKAKLIPVQELSTRMSELGDKSKPVVIYCRTGSRAAMARHMLCKAGFTDVVNAGTLARVSQ